MIRRAATIWILIMTGVHFGGMEAWGEVEIPTVTTREEAPPASPSEDRLEAAEIQALAPRSAQDLLGAVSGLELAAHGSEGKAAQFFLRGFDAAHGTDLAITVDGRLVNEAGHIHGHGYADTGLLIPEALRRVEVRKGPFELGQGAFATAGQADFSVGVPEERRGYVVGGEAGWPARARAWGLIARPGGEEREVIAGEVLWDGGPYENRETRRLGLLAQQRVGPVMLRGGVQAARFGLPGALPLADLEAGRVERSGTYTPETFGEAREVWVGALREHRGGGWRGETSLDFRARGFDARENFTGEEISETQDSGSAVIAHRGTRSATPNLELRWWAGASGELLRQASLQVQRGGEGAQGGAHLAAGVQWMPREWLRAEAGLRGEVLGFSFEEAEHLGGERGSGAVLALAPRGRVTLYASDAVHFVGSLGRGYRPPELGLVEEGLAVTTVDAAEVGVLYSPELEGAGLTLSANVFGYRAGAEFLYDHVSRVQIDRGPTERLGGEVIGRLSLGDSFRLRGHASAVRARLSDTGEMIPFVPSWEAGLLGSYFFADRFVVGLRGRVVSPRPLPFGARAAGVALVDARVGGALGDLDWQLVVENLLNSDWDQGVYHYPSQFSSSEASSGLPRVHVVPGPPRTLRLQVAHRF